ncbi:hypothetical protein [Arcticibacter sp. MXS-1]|uniref:hypothetical protein n=1 Tax=Arcticibacter sp. MXS-1 TaxID=3341726 RepID=UPI0035A9A3DA
MTPTISFKSILFGMAKLLVPTLLFIVTTSILQGIVFFLLGIPFTDRLSYGSIPPCKTS